MITDIIQFIIKKLAGLLIFMSIIYGGGYFVLNKNPKLKEQLSGVFSFMKSASDGTGLNAEQMANALNAVTGKKTEVPDEYKDIDISKIVTPRNLQPLLDALKNSPKYPMYVSKLAVERVGEDGRGAIPILEKALAGNNTQLKQAAYQCLVRIGTIRAKQVIAKYVK